MGWVLLDWFSEEMPVIQFLNNEATRNNVVKHLKPTITCNFAVCVICHYNLQSRVEVRVRIEGGGKGDEGDPKCCGH